MKILKRLTSLLIILSFAVPVFSQDNNDSESGFNFTMDMELGAETFNDGPAGSNPITYQKLSLYPDLSIGKVGVGLAITLHYRFTDDGSIDFRDEDWTTDASRNFLDVYLPIFRYVRYGYKGDPLYAKIGSIDDGTLGNGFIMGGYSNTNFLPERRIAGLALDVDGSLFNFPYAGIETLTGNLARFDVFGTRIYARPLAGTDLPIVKNLQIGVTYAADNDPNALDTFRNTSDPDKVSMYGFDFRQPVLNSGTMTLAVFGDFDIQPASDSGLKTDAATGGMLGVGGKLIGFINYGLSALFLGANFVPFYFDSSYDLFREAKYDLYTDGGVPAYTGWLVSMGFSFLKDMFVFRTSVDGAFSREDNKPSTYPHLKATVTVAEGILPGIYFDASYDKRYIEDFKDLFDPENAVIGANINYKTGPAVITLGYDLRYDPTAVSGNKWTTTARLSTSISLF